ncbi:helix-turn-helix transcriptional regulator [Pedobacter aquatilis]|uniref:helix-turn-helix domain-containing protein n=1 Tax=Pedobacter aquatilis TaxID=351343 RepID=UPI00292D0FD1|nr:helix-turn-helix transcriptional regulator [Pedobacter aquatilis]
MEPTRKAEILKAFGLHLKKLRSSKDVSLRVLEQLADVDHSQIHRIEKGETAPSIITLLSLAEGLKIDPKDLLDFK